VGYATLQDLQDRIGPSNYLKLTDDEGTGQPNETRAQEALQAAEAEVDSYLSRRFKVPVDVTGEDEAAALLKSVTLDLAEYRLHARRPPVPEDVRIKAEVARLWLEKVATGQANLPVSRAVAETDIAGEIGRVTGSQRVFRRDDVEQEREW